MSAQIHVEMHEEHRLWKSEIGNWRDDIRAWQHELATVGAQLKELEDALKEHEQALRQHAASVRMDEQKVGAHEHALAGYEAGGNGMDLPGLVQKHKEEAERQVRQRSRHEELKGNHHAFMARWRSLIQSLTHLA